MNAVGTITCPRHEQRDVRRTDANSEIPGIWSRLVIISDGHLQEFENLLLSVGEFCGKDDGVITRFDFVSFNVAEESDDIEDSRSGTWSALWVDGYGSDFLLPHGAAKCSLD